MLVLRYSKGRPRAADRQARSVNDVWRPLKAAVIAAPDGLRTELSRMGREAATNPSFNVVGAVMLLSLDAYAKTLTAGWRESAGAALKAARRRTIREARRKSGVIHKDDKINLALEEVLALEWLDTRGGMRIASISAETRKAITGVVSEGIAKGWSIPEMVRRIRGTVGLTHRDAMAVTRRQTELMQHGMGEGAAQKDAERYRLRLLRLRAETIARTETVAAQNAGNLQAWKMMQDTGELPVVVLRKWIPALSERTCPVCVALGSHPPIPLNQPFTSPDVGQIM